MLCAERYRILCQAKHITEQWNIKIITNDIRKSYGWHGVGWCPICIFVLIFLLYTFRRSENFDHWQCTLTYIILWLKTFIFQIYNQLRVINWLFFCVSEYCSIFKQQLAQKHRIFPLTGKAYFSINLTDHQVNPTLLWHLWQCKVYYHEEGIN